MLKWILPFLFFIVAQLSAAQAQYTVTNLNGISGDVNYSATAMNNAGQVVGQARDTDGYTKPVIWQSGSSTPTVIGLFSYFPYAMGNAVDINDDGKVVGYCNYLINGSYVYKAFLWSNGVLQDITPPGWRTAQATGINNDGVVVGSGSITGYGNNFFAYDTRTSTYTYYTEYSSSKVNKFGLVPVYVAGGGNSLTVLNIFTGLTFTISHPTGLKLYGREINENGQICGEAYDSSTNITTPYIYTPKGTNGSQGWVKDLGRYNNGLTAAAKGVNSFGHVVGWAYPSSGSTLAFLYEGGGYISLATLVPSGTPQLFPQGINDHRQILCTTNLSTAPRAVVLNRNL